MKVLREFTCLCSAGSSQSSQHVSAGESRMSLLVRGCQSNKRGVNGTACAAFAFFGFASLEVLRSFAGKLGLVLAG